MSSYAPRSNRGNKGKCLTLLRRLRKAVWTNRNITVFSNVLNTITRPSSFPSPVTLFITRLSSWEGWYRKSTNQIARLPVWYFPSIRPVPCVSDRKSNFSKWRMRRRSRFANFLLETQSNSCPGDEGPHFELGLDMWNNLGRPEEAAEHENGEVITNSSWALQDFIEEHQSNLTRWGKLFRSHLAWSALVQRWIRQKNRNYSVNYSCTRNPTNTISLILAIFARWILVAFAVLVFSDTKSRVINLLLTEFARAVLGEYRPSVFLVRTSPKRLGPYCQDLGPIFFQYGPRTRSIRYM